MTIYLLGRYFTSRRRGKMARLRQISLDSPYNGEPEAGVFGAWAPALAAQLPESQAEHKEFRQMLRQAGIYQPRASETIYALRFIFLVAPLMVAGILAVLLDRQYTAPVVVTGVVVAAILVIVPRLYVFFRRRRQMRRIREGLADVIDMLGMCVSGGLPLSAGLEQVAQRMTAYPECANELLLLKRQAELGGIKRALEDFTQRVNLPEAVAVGRPFAPQHELGHGAGRFAGQAGRSPAVGPAASGLDRGQQDAGQADLPHHVLFRTRGTHSLDRAGDHAVAGVSPRQPD